MSRKIAFMGAGAVGGYVGGHMARAGEDVTLIDPWPDHIEAIKRDGLHLEGTQGEHLVRTPWIDRGVLSSNDFGVAPQPRHLLKIHAPKFNQGGVGFHRHTEQVVISDNVFRSDGGHQWSVAIGPQNALYDETI